MSIDTFITGKGGGELVDRGLSTSGGSGSLGWSAFAVFQQWESWAKKKM